MNALPGNNTGSHHFNPAELIRFNRSFAVNRFPHSRYHSSENSFTYGHLSDPTGPFDHIAFLDVDVFTHNGHTHIVFFEVEHQSQDPAGKFHQFQRHHLLKAVDSSDPITD